MHKDPKGIINERTELFGACQHNPTFHRYCRTIASTEEADKAEKESKRRRSENLEPDVAPEPKLGTLSVTEVADGVPSANSLPARAPKVSSGPNREGGKARAKSNLKQGASWVSRRKSPRLFCRN